MKFGRIPKQYRPLLQAAVDQGWRVEARGSKTLVFPPDGSRPQVFHGTPNTKRAFTNRVADMRRAGLRF